jgi:hypothetical protein
VGKSDPWVAFDNRALPAKPDDRCINFRAARHAIEARLVG